jgi:hypothetical protein
MFLLKCVATHLEEKLVLELGASTSYVVNLYPQTLGCGWVLLGYTIHGLQCHLLFEVTQYYKFLLRCYVFTKKKSFILYNVHTTYLMLLEIHASYYSFMSNLLCLGPQEAFTFLVWSALWQALVLWVPSQWAFKHSLVCYEFSSV